MPYKHLEKQREAQRKWWSDNKERENKKRHVKREQRRKWFREYKRKLSCVRCGEHHIACIDLHHIAKKEIGISHMLQHAGLTLQ